MNEQISSSDIGTIKITKDWPVQKRAEPKKRAWSAEQRAKHAATTARKRREKAKAGRSRPKGRKAPAPFVERLGGAIVRAAKGTGGHKGDAARLSDALVYLEHAVGHYTIPDGELLALLALRRLQGRIK
jgi:hypothetical protein